MPNRLTIKLLKRLRLKESWVIFFILGIIMMNFPFIQVFNKHGIIAGMPPLFLYLYIGWLISILVIYLFIKAVDMPADNTDQGNED
jgi:hypothetical protein